MYLQNWYYKSISILWLVCLLVIFESSLYLKLQSNCYRKAFMVYPKTNSLRKDSSINLPYTKYTTTKIYSFFHQNFLSTHTCQTLGLHKWTKLDTNATIKQFTSMEKHRMPCKQAMTMVCYSGGGCMALSGKSSKSETWILQREGIL